MFIKHKPFLKFHYKVFFPHIFFLPNYEFTIQLNLTLKFYAKLGIKHPWVVGIQV